MIEDQDSSDTWFHTLYALSLAKSAIDDFEAESTSQYADNGRTDGTNILVSETNVLLESPVRKRLQIFLQSSDLYDPEEVLDLIEGSELWWEKVCCNSFSYLSLDYALLTFLAGDECYGSQLLCSSLPINFDYG